MSQAVLPYEVEVGARADTLTGRGGLPLVVETLRALGRERVIEAEGRVRQRASGYTEAEKVEALGLRLAAGGDCWDDSAVWHADAGLCRLLGGPLPSADALRQFLYAFHDAALIAAAQAQRAPTEVAYIPEENAALQGRGRVNVALVHGVAAQGQGRRATLDHDATIQESPKRAAQGHDKGGRGYQPAAIYWVEQDLVVADEYRDGNVPAAMDNLRLIQRGFASLPPTVTEYYFRADSAGYDERVLKWLAHAQRLGGPAGPLGVTISADMTEALHALCVAVPEAAWTPIEARADETVMGAEVEFTPGDWPKAAGPLRYLALRIRKTQGRLFAAGHDTKYLAVVTNRKAPLAELVRGHWQKAGTIALGHDVTKNERGAAGPPGGRFGAKAAWYRLSLLTYNVLSALKSLALPAHLSAARPTRLRFAVFTLAGRILTPAGRLVLRISAEAERLAGRVAARTRLGALRLRIASG